jgi:hypothetical protein
MWKKILVLCLWGSCLFSSEELPFYKETEHFQAYCLDQDCAAADMLLQDLEQFWIKWSEGLFAVSCSQKLKFKIYPDVASYHFKIFGNSSPPEWPVCTFNHRENSFSIISPKNPGFLQSAEAILQSGRVCVGRFLLFQKYGTLPFWLSVGLSYYEVKMHTQEQVYEYLLNKRNEIYIPPLSLLEEPRVFSKRSELLACYVLAEFLIDNWGWEKAFNVLNDYSSFEMTLGVSKEEFCAWCFEYVQKKVNAQL